MDPYAPTDADLASPADSPVRVSEIRRIDVMSVARLTSLLYGAIGFLFGGLYGVMMILGGVIGAASGEPEALVMAGVGVGMILILPIFYGVLGAIAAAIGALLYNLVAGWMGGIRLELHDVG